MAGRLFIYSGSDNGSLLVYDTETQKPSGSLTGHDKDVKLVTAKGNLAASVQHGGYGFRLWSLASLQCTANVVDDLDDDGGPYASITAVCCSEDKVLLGSEYGPIKLWDVAASSPCALPDLLGHSSEVNDVKISASGSIVLSGANGDQAGTAPLLQAAHLGPAPPGGRHAESDASIGEGSTLLSPSGLKEHSTPSSCEPGSMMPRS